MRGLYLNCDGANIPASVELANKYSKTFIFPTEIGQGQVIYNESEWPSSPIATIEEHTFVVSGWFIYLGQRNNIEQLANDIINKCNLICI